MRERILYQFLLEADNESGRLRNALHIGQNEDHNNVDDTGIDYQADTIYVRFKDTAPAETVGQLADTILVLDSVKDAIVISNNLIKKVDGTKVVYVLKNGEKTAVEVETGLSTGSQTEIRSGLKEGDEIVIR